MKRKNLIFVMLLVLSGLVTMQSCKKDTVVAFTEHGAFTVPALVAPANGVFIDLTGTTVDLKWESTSSTGDAQKWDVYFGNTDDPAKIQSDYTSQTVTVTVATGTKYWWKVIGTDANGVITRSEVWSFEIVDPAAKMNMKMSWSTNAKDAVGLDLDPLLVANLRLLIRKADLSVVKTVNTTGFEEYNDWNTLADGKYFVATDLSTTVDAGDFNSPIDISIDLTFNQRGVQYVVESFPAVMTNKFACTTYRVYLGFMVKAGSTYTFTKQISYPVSALSGVWYGLDNTGFEYDSEVETYMGCSLQVKGLSFGWMSDYWGEVIVKGGSASITINTTTGVVTIPNQFYCRTKYNGAVQPDYFIEGTGTYDATGPFPKMTITYDLLQNGVSMASQDPLSDPNFVATLTLNPAGLKGAKSLVHFNAPAVKPAH